MSVHRKILLQDVQAIRALTCAASRKGMQDGWVYGWIDPFAAGGDDPIGIIVDADTEDGDRARRLITWETLRESAGTHDPLSHPYEWLATAFNLSPNHGHQPEA